MRSVDCALVMLPNPALDNPLMYPNLGVLYLGAVLRLAGHTVQVVDMRGLFEPDRSLIPDAELVGFSATSGEIGHAKSLSRLVRADGMRTVIGGAHASLFPEDCTPYFDYVVVGEGEPAIVDILKGNGPRLVRVPRLYDLSDIPFPEWNLIPRDKLFSAALFPGEKYGKGPPAATIIGSRGCPYKCAFCANVLRAPVIYRHPDSIVTEMLMLREYFGIYHFRLEDDSISLNRRWLKGLCHGIRGLHVSWKCHTRADLVDNAMCGWLANSGCEEVGLGIETADDGVLSLVSKGITSHRAFDAIKTIQRHGMRAKVYLMSGLPGETERTIAVTKAFMSEARPNKWTLAMFMPYPGCAIWNNPAHYGVNIVDREFEHYWNFPESAVHTVEGATLEDMNDRYRRLKRWLLMNQL